MWSDRSGLTLLELVVALTVAGLALAAGYRAFETVLDLRGLAVETSEISLRTSAVRHTLRSWIAGARLTADPGGPPFRGLDGRHEETPRDEIEFLTVAATPLGGRQTIMRLYVERSDSTPEKGLVVAFSEWRGTGVSRVEVDPRVTGLEARYLSSVLGRREWRPSWISSSVLPAGVELRLIGAGSDPLPPLLELPILVPIAGGR